jgi:hypothetical protein
VVLRKTGGEQVEQGCLLAYVGFLFETLEGVGEELGVAGCEIDGVVGGCHGCGVVVL